MGIVDVDVQPAQIIATGVVGTASCIMMGADAMASASQAKRHAAAGIGPRLNFSLAPTQRYDGMRLKMTYAF